MAEFWQKVAEFGKKWSNFPKSDQNLTEYSSKNLIFSAPAACNVVRLTFLHGFECVLALFYQNENLVKKSEKNSATTGGVEFGHF